MKKFLCLFLTAMLLITGAVIIPVSASELEVTPPAPTTTGDYVAPEFIGIQTRDNGDDTQDIRFVATVASTKGKVLGFDVYANGQTYNFEGDTVYTQIKASDKTFKASDEGAEALFVVVLENVPTTIATPVQFDVRTYVQYGEDSKARSYNTTFEMNGVNFDQELNAPALAWATQGGTGTADNPYVLTQANFDTFYTYYLWSTAPYNHFNKEYISLESDVNANTAVRGPMDNFNGHFNGNGNTISGLNVESDLGFAAMFVVVEGGAIIENLRVVNSTFTNKKVGYVGAGTIVSQLKDGRIKNCYSAATITTSTGADGSNVALGGIVGIMMTHDLSLVDSCVFNGTVTGQYCITGGIVGKVNNGAWSVYIQRCTNKGTVTGNMAGSILGKTESDYTQIICCVNEGTVSTKTGTKTPNGEIGEVETRTNWRVSDDEQYLKQ
ncbi:MAG: hypothetical protein J6B71_00880 [Clostridia bacterium]|nr:hypothetical protein [Clostridia bacterium]